MDELAAKLGLDPLDLRLKNALRTGDTWLGGQRIDAGSLPECLDRLRTATDWANRANRAPTQPGRKRAVGIAALSHICGILSTSAIVRVLEDGTVTLSTGAVDLGEGSDTALAQICAETLQVDVNVVNHATPDTDGSPYNWSTGGSRVTYMVGRAVHQAAAEVRDKLFRHAADVFECATEDLELRPGGQVGLVGVPGRTVSFHALSMRAHWQVGGPIIGNASVMYDGGGIDPKQVVATGNSLGKLGVFIFGAQAVELEVDEETGQVHVLHVWAAHDVGRAINPASVQGQIIGGVAQGLGYALLEDLVFDGARPANPTLMDYKTPGALDLPPITPIIVEHPEPTGPFGAKGVGEPPIVAIAPAVANAIAAATGTRLRKLPFTPERVLDGLGG
jgi:CO/xanthine dehydrogenase Mo-binding subunit